jgi:hypothetical protein
MPIAADAVAAQTVRSGEAQDPIDPANLLLALEPPHRSPDAGDPGRGHVTADDGLEELSLERRADATDLVQINIPARNRHGSAV